MCFAENLAHLRDKLIECIIPMPFINNWVNSMKRRVGAVIAGSGGPKKVLRKMRMQKPVFLRISSASV